MMKQGQIIWKFMFIDNNILVDFLAYIILKKHFYIAEYFS